MSKSKIWIAAGTLGGVTLMGAAALMVWNSKQMRTARMMRRAGKILYKTGSVLQSVSGVSDVATGV